MRIHTLIIVRIQHLCRNGFTESASTRHAHKLTLCAQHTVYILDKHGLINVLIPSYGCKFCVTYVNIFSHKI